ncbi:MAG: hypothetical protein MJY86_04705 [Bacteroidales bacterium]|nr:hypothetical protein [Bacteroidales bacterium]
MNPFQFFLKALHKLYVLSHPWSPDAGSVSDPEEVSRIIFELLSSDKPCMICRYGSVELMNVTNQMSVSSGNKPILRYITDQVREWWWNEANVRHMKDNAGFFPNDEAHFDRFAELILNDTKFIDVLGSWIFFEKYMEGQFPDSMVKVPLQQLEPFWSKIPWTKALEGKKVLVVHPFASLIEKQYRTRRRVLFGDREILPEFNLKTLKAVQSIGGKSEMFVDWFEALKYMEEEIDRIDYDICLIGCGAYGFPLAAHVKRMGKKAVHLGGVLQILFGIRGKRWDDPMYGVADRGLKPGMYLELVNEYWVRPDVDMRPSDAQAVEGGCYW